MKGRLLGLAVLATATMANAAAQLDAGNKTVAEELTAGGYTTVGITNTYKVDQNIPASGSKIKLTVNGAKFTGNTIYLCNGTTKVGGGNIPTNLQNDVSLSLDANLTQGTQYYFGVPDPGDTDKCLAGGYIQYHLNNLTEGQRVVLTVTGIGNAAVNADAVGTVATIKRQFTAKVDPTTAKVDLKTFKNFVTSSLVTSITMKTGFKIISDETIDRRVDLVAGSNDNTCDWKLGDDKWAVDFKLKGKLQEYSTIEILDPRAATLIQYKISADDRKNSQVTIDNFNLNTNGIACKSPSANPTYIQLKVDGLTQIQEDTKKLTITLKRGLYSRNLTTDVDAFIVNFDGTVLYVPLVGYDPSKGRNTYIKLQMTKNTVSSADVIFQVLASDGNIVTTKIPGKDQLKAGVPLAIDASEIVNAVKAAGKTLYEDGESFAVKIIVLAPESDIFAYANIVDNNGNSFKRVPVKVLNGKILE